MTCRYFFAETLLSQIVSPYWKWYDKLLLLLESESALSTINLFISISTNQSNLLTYGSRLPDCKIHSSINVPNYEFWKWSEHAVIWFYRISWYSSLVFWSLSLLSNRRIITILSHCWFYNYLYHYLIHS